MAQKPTIGLSYYVVRVKDESSLLRKPPLGYFDRKHNLIDVFEDYLKPLVNLADDVVHHKVFRIRDLKKTGAYLCGILETGEYGTRQEILNAKTKAKSYTTKKEDAILTPFFFMFWLPGGEDRGIMAVQRFKQYGIFDTLSTFLTREIKKQFAREYRVEYTVLTNSDIVDKMIDESRIRELSFTQFEWPDDLADEINNPPNLKKGSVTVTISAGYDSTLPFKKKLKRMFNGNLPPGRILELEKAGFPIQPDQVTVDLFNNGKSRKVSYADALDLRSIFDVTEDVEFDEDRGHPTPASVETIAKEILDDAFPDFYHGKIRDEYKPYQE